ncbi:hypothetical protein RHSP_19711 [Rhizobium freirei PRF 81]|uniref:Uncharacterized protein n=1 Tax=Rhizobium freirei PRF 81 TaxID=363754 RepID=N6U812_9HYPH|nr:hypothetical protein RHSP_19711 [Rhizobium freirei PRF 81]
MGLPFGICNALPPTNPSFRHGAVKTCPRLPVNRSGSPGRRMPACQHAQIGKSRPKLMEHAGSELFQRQIVLRAVPAFTADTQHADNGGGKHAQAEPLPLRAGRAGMQRLRELSFKLGVFQLIPGPKRWRVPDQDGDGKVLRIGDRSPQGRIDCRLDDVDQRCIYRLGSDGSDQFAGKTILPGRDHIFLAREVIEEAAFGNIGRLGDIFDSRAVEAAREEELQCSGLDTLAGLAALPFAPAFPHRAIDIRHQLPPLCIRFGSPRTGLAGLLRIGADCRDVRGATRFGAIDREFQRILPRYPVNSSRRDIAHRAADAGALQAQAFEDRPLDRTARAISELIEGSARFHHREGTADNGGDFRRRHGQKRQAADNGTERSIVKQTAMAELRRIHLHHPGLGKTLPQTNGKFLAEFDEREGVFRNSARQQSPRENTGAGTEFEDGAVKRIDLLRHQPG